MRKVKGNIFNAQVSDNSECYEVIWSLIMIFLNRDSQWVLALPPMIAESLLTPSGITLSSFKGNSASEGQKGKHHSHAQQLHIQNISLQKKNNQQPTCTEYDTFLLLLL